MYVGAEGSAPAPALTGLYRSDVYRKVVHAVRCTLLLMSMPLASSGQQALAVTQQQTIDLMHRDSEIHWPPGFDPVLAAQFSHNELLIHAPCAHVFERMAKVAEWPNWFILVKQVRVAGSSQNPAVGRTLSLSIFDTPITAKITEWVPGERIGWLPETLTPSETSHYHIWHFVSASEGCKVVTEEVGVGPSDKKMGPEGSFYMHRAHDLWLASLRYTSE